MATRARVLGANQWANEAYAVELLPATPYSGRDPIQYTTIGLCLERQRGVHSLGTDRRSDFDRLPGTISVAPAGCDVFSESPEGGEFLAIRLADRRLADLDEFRSGIVKGRHDAILAIGVELRAAMLRRAPTQYREELVFRMLAALGDDPDIEPHRAVWIGEAIERLKDAVDAEAPINLLDLAFGFGLTASGLTRGFRRSLGMTPSRLVLELRLQRARRLLSDSPGLTLGEVAAASGFAHQSHLGSVMRAQLGATPLQYRMSATT